MHKAFNQTVWKEGAQNTFFAAVGKQQSFLKASQVDADLVCSVCGSVIDV
jgi:hypothetical protein